MRRTIVAMPLLLGLAACQTYGPGYNDPYGYPPYGQPSYPAYGQPGYPAPYPGQYPQGYPQAYPYPGGPTPALDQSNWRVDSINGVRVPSTNFYLDFVPTGLDGKFGCNALHGTYRASGSQISFGPIAATRMACPTMDFERQGLAVLARPVTAEWMGQDRLTLRSSGGTILLVRAGNDNLLGNIFR